MKRIFLYMVLFVATAVQISCSKSELKEEFSCSDSFSRSETKSFKDVMKKFKIRIPKTWKTELYYDQYVSEIFSADTTKQLSDSYIIDVVWHQGELNINDELIGKVKSSLDSTGMSTQKEKVIRFRKFPAYYNLSKGRFKNMDYHLLQVLIKVKPDEYVSFTTKIYGDKRVDERLCESVAIYEDFTILE